ncbi:MAG: glycosyltransferase [Ginsengibacter sp.]
MKFNLLFIIPVYNDWVSAYMLQKEIENISTIGTSRLYLIINDSSTMNPDANKISSINSPTVILNLNANMGHQRAIAIGLAYASDNLKSDHIIVMDSDGEDKPSDIERLLFRSKDFDGIVFAKRTKRHEGLTFRFYYLIYKIMFKTLTGKKISFGNFCLIPGVYLKKITFVPEIWNHFSGGIIRSGIPYTAIPLEKGKRYHGTSKMNFTKLILHGLSAISVYADYMAIRLILLSLFLIMATLFGISIVAFIRIFTKLAIPGWATSTVLGLSILLLLSLILGLFLIFNLLSLKTYKSIVPAKDYQDYILSTSSINAN